MCSHSETYGFTVGFFEERKMKIISGKEVAEHITSGVKSRIEDLKALNKRLPKLVIVRVGEKPDDLSYQKGAVKRMDMTGIEHEEVYFEAYLC